MATATTSATEASVWTPGDVNSIAPVNDCLEPTLARADVEAMYDDFQAQALDLACCRTAPWYWLVNHCATLDEDDAAQPYKRFPPRPFLQALANLWWWTGVRYSNLALPKSRKMLVTWTISLLFFGECQFKPGRRNMVQSYKLLESEAIIAKVKGVWERQPQWIRQNCTWTSTEARFGNDSVFIAAPGGAEQLQGPTLSGYMCDEVGDHEEAQLTYEAALPACGKTGRMVLVGRCPPSWWYSTFLADLIGEPQ